MKQIGTIGLLAALSGLGGCSWLLGDEGFFPDTSDRYRSARPAPGLEVPQDLDDSALQQIYVIPDSIETATPAGEFEVPRPAPLVTGATEQLVRIQRLGREEWILVELNPGQLWPQVRGYLSSSDMPVARVEARQGLIETGWLPGQEGGMQERYRFRMEQGVQRNTSELHVLQMFRAGDLTGWPEVSADSEHEASMLRSIAQFIANNAGSAPVSMMAQQSLSDGGKISIQEDADGSSYIRLVLPFNRAWASLEKALRESSFEVLDKDRSQGRYQVAWAPPEDEDDEGMFGWLFGDDEDNDANSAFGGKEFVLLMSEADDGSQHIKVFNEDSSVPDPALAQSLLTLVKGNIN